jgi:hypothetical protein
MIWWYDSGAELRLVASSTRLASSIISSKRISFLACTWRQHVREQVVKTIINVLWASQEGLCSWSQLTMHHIYFLDIGRKVTRKAGEARSLRRMQAFRALLTEIRKPDFTRPVSFRPLVWFNIVYHLSSSASDDRWTTGWWTCYKKAATWIFNVVRTWNLECWNWGSHYRRQL